MLSVDIRADHQLVDRRFPLFTVITDAHAPRLVGYSPSELDPRQEANHKRLTTSSILADLETLRTVFDGLVLYGHNEASTPRILAVAKELRFRVVLVGVWNPTSIVELEGVAQSVKQHAGDFAMGVIVGNEGLTQKRYDTRDLSNAAARLRRGLPHDVPLTTSEPLVAYQQVSVRDFGDFLAPNVHPFFDRPQLGAAAAAAWTREQSARLALQSKKPVVVKETGFPHGGSPMHTPDLQKLFWEKYLKPGVTVHLSGSPDVWVHHGVAFEAFDLLWKSDESHLSAESCWGLFSAARKPYPAAGTWQNAK